MERAVMTGTFHFPPRVSHATSGQWISLDNDEDLRFSDERIRDSGSRTEREFQMRKRFLPRPTDAELAILKVLWEAGPSSVRQVHKTLNRRRACGYTTALKLLQIMTEKGLVQRDESTRPQIYRPRLPREHTERQLVADLLERAFGGSARRLVLQALAVKEASPEELAQIEKLLTRLERGGT